MYPIFSVYLSPSGQDSADGGVDTPLASLSEALRRIRAAREQGLDQGPLAEVILAPGLYPLRAPIRVNGPFAHRLRLRASNPGTARLVAAIPVSGWKVLASPFPHWTIDVRSHLREFGPFATIVVGGRLAPRPRWPRQGLFRLLGVPGRVPSPVDLHAGADRVLIAPSDLPPEPHNTEVELCLPHFWVQERCPVEKIEPRTGEVWLAAQTRFVPTDGFNGQWAQAYWDNVGSVFGEVPGEWHLDSTTGLLRYYPHAGESPETTEVLLPTGEPVLIAEGTAECPLQGIEISGLCFEASDGCRRTDERHRWQANQPLHAQPKRLPPAHEDSPNPRNRLLASAMQAAFDLPSALELSNVAESKITGCKFTAIGWQALAIRPGCHRITIAGNVFRHLGAGAIIVDGNGSEEDPLGVVHDLWIDDNIVSDNGWRHPASAGIAILHAHSARLRRNHLHDLTYTGISLGWTWGFACTVARDFLVEGNYIHDLGKNSGMSDLAGIYLLGRMPGTLVRDNIIHGLHAAQYGAWGLYADWGTAQVRFERNHVWDTASEPVHEHWARANLYRDNILHHRNGPLFLLSGEVLQRFRYWPEPEILLLGNILLSGGNTLLHHDANYFERSRYVGVANRIALSPSAIWHSRERYPATTRPADDQPWADALLSGREALFQPMDDHALVELLPRHHHPTGWASWLAFCRSLYPTLQTST